MNWSYYFWYFFSEPSEICWCSPLFIIDLTQGKQLFPIVHNSFYFSKINNVSFCNIKNPSWRNSGDSFSVAIWIINFKVRATISHTVHIHFCEVTALNCWLFRWGWSLQLHQMILTSLVLLNVSIALLLLHV